MSKFWDFIKGQLPAEFEYGGIKNPAEYLKKRYGVEATLVKSAKVDTDDYPQSRFESGANNCSLVSITRVMEYFRDHGYSQIPSDGEIIYKDVKEIAGTYGYTKKKGTSFTKVDDITKDILSKYGYTKVKCKGKYFIWRFNSFVREFEAGRPVILNIARGHFFNHTVTACGYELYEAEVNGKKKLFSFLTINCGWRAGVEYIDYRAWAFDFVHSGIGSYNTTQLLED